MSPTARYPVDTSKACKAGRNIEAKIIEHVRARLDPYGLRTVGWLAQAIGLAGMSDEMERLRRAADMTRVTPERAEPDPSRVWQALMPGGCLLPRGL